MCVSEMMHIDTMGGGGEHSHENRERLEYDSRRDQQQRTAGATVPASGRPSRSEEQPEGMKPATCNPRAGRQPSRGHRPRRAAASIQIAPAQLNDQAGA